MRRAATRFALWILPILCVAGALIWLFTERAAHRALAASAADRLIAPRIKPIERLAQSRSCLSAPCLRTLQVPPFDDRYILTLYDLQGSPLVSERPDLPAPPIERARPVGPGLAVDDRFFWTAEFTLGSKENSLHVQALLEDPDPPFALIGRLSVLYALAVALAMAAAAAAGWLAVAFFVDRPIAAALAASRALAQQPAAPSGPEELARRLTRAVQQSGERLKEMVMNVSHDLRTPVASLRASLEMLQGLDRDDPVAGRLLETVNDQSTFLADMIDDLFEITKYDAKVKRFSREPVGIAELADQTLQAFAAQAAQKGVNLVNRCEAWDAEVIGDGQALRRMLTNILSNAVTQCSQGDTVTLDGRIETDGVMLHVRDTGPGLPAGDHEKLFERYYRGAGEGLGVGLHLAARIVAAHAGQIHAKDTGAGALFSIWLPFTPRDPSAESPE